MGRGRQKKGNRPQCQFLNACCFWGQHRLILQLCPWSESETGHLGGGTPSSRVNMISPEILQFFEKILNPNSICKGCDIRTI